MTEQEYAEISLLIRKGMTISKAAGSDARRVQYQRMRDKKEGKKASPTLQKPQKPQDQQCNSGRYSDKDYSEVIADWKSLPKLKKALLKKNIEVAVNPGDSPQNANIHNKTMVALFPEFRGKNEKASYTPDDFRRAFDEAVSNAKKTDTLWAIDHSRAIVDSLSG